MLASVSLWLSGWRGSKSSVHYDAFHNLLVVVAGEKRVLLWPPAETAHLHPHQLGSESGNHAAVDVAHPERHAGFGDALGRAIAVTLRAGDALFIPEGFWHQVDSSGGTIAVNYWRVALRHALVDASALTLRASLCIGGALRSATAWAATWTPISRAGRWKAWWWLKRSGFCGAAAAR